MATDRPRIQAYVEPDLYSRYQTWKEEKGFDKESPAINALLREFFGEKEIQAEIASTGLSTEDIEELIAQECEVGLREIRQETVGKLPTIPEINAKVEAQVQTWMDEKAEDWMLILGQKFCDRLYRLEQEIQKLDERLKKKEKLLDVRGGIPTLFQEVLESVRQQEYVIEQFQGTTINQLFARIEKVEAIVQPIEGLAEISHPLEPEGIEESLQESEGVESELPSESLELLGNLPDQLTQTELAQRLSCHKSQVSRRKKESNFASWSRGKDPKGIAWQYDRKKERFLPIGAL